MFVDGIDPLLFTAVIGRVKAMKKFLTIIFYLLDLVGYVGFVKGYCFL